MANKKEKFSLSAFDSLAPVSEKERPFVKLNFLLMAVCVLLIVAGFILMAGPGSSAETGFNPEIFSTRRIVVGPTVSFLGFLCMAFAIIYSPRNKKKSKD